MELNLWVFPVAALIPLVTGAIWYNPSVLGKAWMKVSGVTEEDASKGNMLVIFGLTYLLSLFLTGIILPIVVHQSAFLSLMGAEEGFGVAGTESTLYFEEIMARMGDRHRTFGHGAFHGAFVGIMFALPVLGINAMFERKGFKYIAINSGYWILTLALMGGLIAQFA